MGNCLGTFAASFGVQRQELRVVLQPSGALNDASSAVSSRNFASRAKGPHDTADDGAAISSPPSQDPDAGGGGHGVDSASHKSTEDRLADQGSHDRGDILASSH
jgi:hypothetical protein